MSARQSAVAVSEVAERYARLRAWWARHHDGVLRGASAVLAAFAALKLGSEFWRLVADTGALGANDLWLRHTQVQRWFAGQPVYAELRSAIYPPATYPILWPLIGWLEFTPARWLWASTSVVMLGWLAWIVVRESAAGTRPERRFVLLLPLSMNATGVCIGNGQLIVHCLPVLLAGVLVVRRARGRWWEDLLGAALILLALVKPNISAFFFWAVLFLPGRLRPAVLVTGGYMGLTLLAAAWQPASVGELIAGWLHNGGEVAAHSGYDHVERWAAAMGRPEWGLPASVVVLLALAVWTYRHRARDPWIILGVSAIAARVGMYHLVYDDLLLLLPMVALFRLAKLGQRADGSDVVAAMLLGLLTAAMLAPARLQFEGSPWRLWFAASHACVWGLVLTFLLQQARRERHLIWMANPVRQRVSP